LLLQGDDLRRSPTNENTKGGETTQEGDNQTSEDTLLEDELLARILAQSMEDM